MDEYLYPVLQSRCWANSWWTSLDNEGSQIDLMRKVNKSTNRCMFIALFCQPGWKLLIRLPGGTWYESNQHLDDAARCSLAWRSRRVLLGSGKVEPCEDSSGVLITLYDQSQTYIKMTRYSPIHVALLISHV